MDFLFISIHLLSFTFLCSLLFQRNSRFIEDPLVSRETSLFPLLLSFLTFCLVFLCHRHRLDNGATTSLALHLAATSKCLTSYRRRLRCRRRSGFAAEMRNQQKPFVWNFCKVLGTVSGTVTGWKCGGKLGALIWKLFPFLLAPFSFCYGLTRPAAVEMRFISVFIYLVRKHTRAKLVPTRRRHFDPPIVCYYQMCLLRQPCCEAVQHARISDRDLEAGVQ